MVSYFVWECRGEGREEDAGRDISCQTFLPVSHRPEEKVNDMRTSSGHAAVLLGVGLLPPQGGREREPEQRRQLNSKHSEEMA